MHGISSSERAHHDSLRVIKQLVLHLDRHRHSVPYVTPIYSRKLDFEDAGARQGIIRVWKSGLPIMNFLSGDGESMRLGP